MATASTHWIEEALALQRDPVASFLAWFDQAQAAEPQPEAMALATVDGDGRPAARMVLYRGFSDDAVCFFTNYGSRKAQELAGNAQAALLFHWPVRRRQVRIEGRVERLPAAESDAYFEGRDRESQLGAWASRQSTPLATREALELRLEAIRKRFAGGPVPRPEFWGGYRLRPECFEFWQNRPNRLHDRFRYEREGATWRATRLAP